MSTINGQTHLEDGDLVSLLGDELSADERAAAKAHLGRCDACAARLDACRVEVRDAMRLLGALPAATIDPARRARSLAAIRDAASRREVPMIAPTVAPRTIRWPRFVPATALARAAAVAALLVAGGVAASPAGAWIVDRVRDLLQPAERVVAVEEPASTILPAHSSVVGFIPVGDEMVLGLRSAQQGGELVIRIEDTTSASARVTGGQGDLDVIILPGSLLIQNHPRMVARYEVIIPARLERVRVRVGDADEMVLSPAELGAGWSAVVGLQHGSIDAGNDRL
jgi:anti-sigma factor RsiW